jgi:hypothetical protein
VADPEVHQDGVLDEHLDHEEDDYYRRGHQQLEGPRAPLLLYAHVPDCALRVGCLQHVEVTSEAVGVSARDGLGAQHGPRGLGREILALLFFAVPDRLLVDPLGDLCELAVEVAGGVG